MFVFVFVLACSHHKPLKLLNAKRLDVVSSRARRAPRRAGRPQALGARHSRLLAVRMRMHALPAVLLNNAHFLLQCYGAAA